jgi:hypothetical protein
MMKNKRIAALILVGLVAVAASCILSIVVEPGDDPGSAIAVGLMVFGATSMLFGFIEAS